MATADWYRWEDHDLILEIRVQPRARRDELGDIRGAHRCVRIAAPPLDGRANRRLREFIAKTFRVSKSRVTLCSGETGRDKRLRIVAPRCPPSDIDPPT
jgi:uncharacterized protein (TIGR00251 family)